MKSLAILLALGAALLVSACDQKTQASREAPARPVLVAEAHYAPREQAQVLAGVVKARTESDLAFRIAGKMAARLVDMGALVHEGDALARLDETDFRLAARGGGGRAELRESRARSGGSGRAPPDHAVEAGLDGERRFRQGARGRRPGARRRHARRPRGRACAERHRLCDLAGRRGRRDQRGLGGARPGRRGRRADRSPRAHERAGGGGLHSRNAHRSRARRARAGRALGSARRFRRGEAARALADVRSGDAHLPRALYPYRPAARRAARHERHRFARNRRRQGGAPADRRLVRHWARARASGWSIR